MNSLRKLHLANLSEAKNLRKRKLCQWQVFNTLGLLHHSNYLTYFEIGRIELFRTQGGSYRRMEELGLFLWSPA